MSQRCLDIARGSVLILFFTSSRDKWEAARVTRAMSSFSSRFSLSILRALLERREEVALFLQLLA
jgi:hypothetical protein